MTIERFAPTGLRIWVNGGQRIAEGALVSIDAIATNAKIAQTIRDAGANYLPAVKANQPSLRAETQNAFATATALASRVDHDKGHGRIEQRTVDVIPEVDRLDVFAENQSRWRKGHGVKNWRSSDTSPST